MLRVAWLVAGFRAAHDNAGSPRSAGDCAVSEAPETVTGLLLAMQRGDPSAEGKLFVALYEELRTRARNLGGRRGKQLTLQATALVHEAYVRLLGTAGAQYVDRNHFLACASRAMRHIVIDHARRPRPIPEDELPLDNIVAAFEEQVEDMEKFAAALSQLESLDPQMVSAIDMRFFGNSSEIEVAAALGIPLRTFQRRWRAAREFVRKVCRDT